MSKLKSLFINNLKLVLGVAILLIAIASACFMFSPLNNTGVISAYASLTDKGKTDLDIKKQTKFLTLTDLETDMYNGKSELYGYGVINRGSDLGKHDMTSDFNSSTSFKVYVESIIRSTPKNPMVYTAFRLDKKFNRAIRAGALTITVEATVANDDPSQLAFQEGTITAGAGDNFTSFQSMNGDGTYQGLISYDRNDDGSFRTTSFKPTVRSDSDYYDFLLVFANNGSGRTRDKNTITITSPTIKLSVDRHDIKFDSGVYINDNALTLNANNKYVESGANNWASAKNVKVNVKDSIIGIKDYIEVNGDVVEGTIVSGGDDNRTFTFPIYSNVITDYEITAFDYFNQRVSIKVSAGQVDNVDVSPVTITARNTYHTTSFSINLSFIADLEHSDDELYFMLINKRSFNASELNDLEPDPTNTTKPKGYETKRVLFSTDSAQVNRELTCSDVESSDVTDFKLASGSGSYRLYVLIKDADSVGHKKVNYADFSIDTNKRRINIVSHYGNYNFLQVEGSTGVYEDETGLYSWTGEKISLQFLPFENFEYYKFLIDEEEQVLDSSIFNYECESKNINIEIFNRFIVSVNPQLEYVFNEDGTNLAYTTNATLFFDVVEQNDLLEILGVSLEELQTLTSEEQLQMLTTNIVDRLSFSFVKDSFPIQQIYDKGAYTVTWFVNNASAEEDSFFTGGATFTINVSAKGLVVTYAENQTFTYNGEVQTFDFDRKIEGQTINHKYLVAGVEIPFKNAGDYVLEFFVTNANYYVVNNTINLTINKKQVVASVSEVSFVYNATTQNVPYTLSENIETSINYYVDVEGSLVPQAFKNSGVYTYEISANDSVNYLIVGDATGSCEIEKIYTQVKLNKSVYDYISAVLSLDFDLLDLNGNKVNNINYFEFNDATNELVEVENLIVTFKVNDVVTSFMAPNTYNYEITTLDTFNYVLTGDYLGEVIVNPTVIKIYLEETEYEYTGEVILPKFKFKNGLDNPLEQVNNINVKYVLGENDNASLINKGTYTYYFEKEDEYYELVYLDEVREVTVVSANVEIANFVTRYVYNPLGTTLSYDILSQIGKVNYLNNANIVRTITYKKTGESVASVTDAGVYTISFSSINPNIVLVNADDNGVIAEEIVVSAKPVTITNLVNEYNYTGSEITFIYELSEEIEVSVSIETLLNAGEYNYEIVSLSNNYVIVDDEISSYGIVVVKPREVTLQQIKTDYVYNGSNINVMFTLNEEIEYAVSYKVNAQENAETLTSIVNANTYNIYITPSDNNLFVNTENILIVVNRKQVEINVSNTTFDYNKTNRTISVETEASYQVKYYVNGEETENTANAGEYNYVVTITNPNFAGSAEGTMVVNKINASVIVSADQYKVYGDETAEEYAYRVEGLIEGDEVEVNLTRENKASNSVGSYEILLVSAENNNYNINYIGGFYKIIARKIYLIADNITKHYEEQDGELTYRINYGSIVEGDDLSCVLSREEGEDVGIYKITIGAVANANYQVILKSATFTILPSDLQIVIDDVTTEYGTQKELTFTAEREYNKNAITGSITRESGENAGKYEISAGTLQSKNYNLIVKNGVYTITPKQVKLFVTSFTKTYGEQDNISFEVVGLINNEVLLGSLGREEGEDVGLYLIKLGELETLNPNYELVLNECYYTITKASISIVIDNLTQVYGEEEKEYTYSVIGLKFEDKLELDLFRKAGNDVGEYAISSAFTPLTNYVIDSLQTGVYTIEKANPNIVLEEQVVVYNGKKQNFTNTNFPYELTYVYEQFGMEVSEVVNAGTYYVKAHFAGNNNYNEGESNKVKFIVNKVSVCLNLAENVYLYDGEAKFPQFTFDASTGLDKNTVIWEFEDGSNPVEVGKYNFSLIINDANFEGGASGVLTITKPVTVVTNSGVVECEDLEDASIMSNIKLVSKSFANKFADKQVLQACSFENAETIEEGHVYTVRIKAKTQDSNVYVYKIDKNNNATEVVASYENGYYVFKVDSLDGSFIITKDVEPMSLITIAIIIGVSILVIVTFVITFAIIKKRKKKLALKLANTNAQVEVDAETLTENAETATQKTTEPEIKNVRIDEVVENALNKGTSNLDQKEE